MSNLELINIFYRQNKEVAEYKDIFFETNLGILKHNVTSIDFTNCNSLEEMNRVEEIDKLREIYGRLYINEVRKTYDNNLYMLISGKFILGIEYVLNSSFINSVQEFRIIENIHGSNTTELDDFKELDIVELPSLP